MGAARRMAFIRDLLNYVFLHVITVMSDLNIRLNLRQEMTLDATFLILSKKTKTIFFVPVVGSSDEEFQVRPLSFN